MALDTVPALNTDGLRSLSDSPIEVRVDGDIAPIEVDSRRIRRIVTNLLANAIEHGESKPIEVTLESTATDVVVSIRDHGIGMTAEQSSHVFERFWRADPSRTRALGGTGLGLAIAQEDAQLHGGTISVWSQPGLGAEFTLKLPRGVQS